MTPPTADDAGPPPEPPSTPAALEHAGSAHDEAALGSRGLSRLRRSLSTRLLVLTIVFILIAEIVVMIPSMARFRRDWFMERVETAFLIMLALESPQGEMIDPEQAEDLFMTGGVRGVSIERGGARILVMSQKDAGEVDGRPPREHYVDVKTETLFAVLTSPWATLASRGDDLIHVIGEPQFASEGEVDLVVSQAALRESLATYARNILGLSILISAIAGGLVYFALNRSIVMPVKRLSQHMRAFEKSPEDPALIVRPSDRADEIGVAERSLENLQRRIQSLLAERRRLAALGSGISKISHDLRNVLASAQLMSDRLAKSDDPRVRKLSPPLIGALDRAVGLSRDTLNFARMGPSALKPTKIDLRKLVGEVFEDVANPLVSFENDVPADLRISGDQTHVYRALANLSRNAVEAMTAEAQATQSVAADDGADETPDEAPAPPSKDGPRLRIAARCDTQYCEIDVIDNGPGLPDKARDELFEPFKGSMKPGGSGLGVAIAFEIARAHGGQLSLLKSSAEGATFRMRLPTAPIAIA